MLKQLFSMGVKPEAMLLPSSLDQGGCKLCRVDSLLALLGVLVEQCNGDLSQHKEVIMRCRLQSRLVLFSMRTLWSSNSLQLTVISGLGPVSCSPYLEVEAGQVALQIHRYFCSCA